MASQTNKLEDPTTPRPQTKGFLSRFYKAVASSVDPYHLLWSPQFGTKVVVTTGALWIAQMMLGSKTIPLPGSVASLFDNLLLPLLASACCLLQLGLNVLAVGCAGFNTILGPLRPYFLGLLLFGSIQRRNLPSTLVRLAVALMPEGLHLLNQRSFSLTTRGTPVSIVEFEVPTMGCVACINSIQNAIVRDKAVVKAKASLYTDRKGGKVVVQISQEPTQDKLSTLCLAVQQAGFDGCSVASINNLR
jgi:hypothetical protein